MKNKNKQTEYKRRQQNKVFKDMEYFIYHNGEKTGTVKKINEEKSKNFSRQGL